MYKTIQTMTGKKKFNTGEKMRTWTENVRACEK